MTFNLSLTMIEEDLPAVQEEVLEVPGPEVQDLEVEEVLEVLLGSFWDPFGGLWDASSGPFRILLGSF